MLGEKLVIPFEAAKKWGGYHAHDANSDRALTLALAYKATGDTRFATGSLEVLRGYAGQYTKFRDKFHSSSLTGALYEQLLDESIWLVKMAKAYDILRGAGAVSEADRDLIENGLFAPAVEVELKGPITNNHTWWYKAAIGTAGFAMGRKDFIDDAIDGPRGYKKLIAAQVNDDGLLCEASIAYHYFALRAFQSLADTAFEHGVDMYNMQMDDATGWDGFSGKKSVKMMFDALLYFPFQDSTMPAVKDSGPQTGGFVEEWRDLSDAYAAHYDDPARLALMKRYPEIQKRRTGDPGGLRPVNPGDGAFALNGKNILGSTLYPSTGYAILRDNPDSFDAPSANMTYGPYGGGHGHPDKLSISLYANREIILPDLGRYDYGDPLQQDWIKQTISHNTVTVDGRSQAPMNFEGMNEWAEGAPDNTGAMREFSVSPHAKIMRATSDTVVKGVTLDRTVVLFDGLVFDVFRATSAKAHTYDYALHVNGALTRSNFLKKTEKPAPLGKGFGYQHLTNVLTGERPGNSSWISLWKSPEENGLAIAVAGDGADVFTADTPGNPPSATMPMIVVRHKGESATFMTAFLPLGKEAIPTSIGGITADALKIASAAAPEDLPAGVGFAPGSGAFYIIAVSPAGSIYEITPLKIFTDAGLLAIETGKEGGDLIALHRFKTFSFGKEQGGINASAPVNYIEMLAGTAGRMAATAETEKENELTFGKDVIGGMASVCKSIAANLPDGSKQAVPADAPFKIDLPAGRSEFGFTCEDNKK